MNKVNKGMGTPASPMILCLVVVLLVTFDLLTCVHSQGAGGAKFSLNGTTYQNNSLVTLEDIDGALLCMIDLTACFNWFFPNGTRVPSQDSQWDFYTDRAQMVVQLHRRRGGENGIYRCEMPNLMNVTQTIYIGVYTASTGSPNVTSLTFDVRSTTLTCTSTGGPATAVTWRRDRVVITLNATHQQTKRLVDAVNGTYQTVLTIDPSVGWSDIVGTYNCTVENDRGVSSETVVVPGAGDIRLSLNGTTFQNNSIVTLKNISAALLCTTDLTACCGSLAKGNWFFPNETRVPSEGKQWDFYRDRGKMVVQLHRRRGGVDGIYRCEIPDSMNVTQSIYIGVYNISTGSPNITSVAFDGQSRTLTCTSTGGPATTVTWRRDGVVITLNATHQQTKRLVDAVNGTYQTVLTIDPSVGCSDIVGTYSCAVRNVRGESSETILTIDPSVGHGNIVGTYNCTVDNDRGESSETVDIPPASIPEETSPSPTVEADTAGTVPVSSSSMQPTKNDGAITTTVPFMCSIQPNKHDRTITTTVPVSSSSIQPTNNPPSDGATTTTGTVPVSSSTQPTNNPPSDGANTTPVIIVVAVVIVLVVIVVGVVILVVIFRAKKRKQQLVINNFQSVKMENGGTEMKLKQEETKEKETSPIADQPPYAEIQTEAPLNVSTKSEELSMEQNNTLTGDYSEIELEQADSKHAHPAKPPRQVNLSDPMSEETKSNPMYQDIDQHCDPTSTTNVSQEIDTYTEPDTSHTVDIEIYETVYSEPIQPSLFADAAASPRAAKYSDDLQPYAPIYTIPTHLPKCEKELLKIFGSNIREIHELGMGQFGKVILAETVGLSAKDLRLSESDDDKSKSTLVTVKKLKSDAPNATKEAFEKEVNFMSRLTDRNVIRILGVCYEDTPFIMMEYMEKGDLNQYLQKFKIHSTTDSEPQGQITTSTLVHITTQVASAMKYLASHNFVHRDLATRNCLVGPNYLVKISDFGMSRSLYDSHYYRIQGSFVLPVRWMAFECFYGKFSQKSDVWAFGVTMWEIFTLAKEQPYNDISDQQVVEDAFKGKNRKILGRPNMCPLEVYKIMLDCWAHNSERRATFEELFRLLTSIYNI